MKVIIDRNGSQQLKMSGRGDEMRQARNKQEICQKNKGIEEVSPSVCLTVMNDIDNRCSSADN